MEHNDILIVGDSFAKHRDLDSDWPTLLATLQSGVTKQPRGQGFAGASWWSIRKCLLAELAVHVPKVLVLCHTEAVRIPSDFDLGLNVASAANAPVHIPDGQEHNYVPKIKEAAAMFYTYLASTDYASWAQAAWFTELEHILADYNIPKIVHLHCFPPYSGHSELHCFNIGVTDVTPLWNLCKDVLQDTARNHFTTEQNIQIAHAINNMLTIYPLEAGFIDIVGQG